VKKRRANRPVNRITCSARLSPDEVSAPGATSIPLRTHVPSSSQRVGELINLCFHGIGRPERILEPGEAAYWVEPEQFDEMLSVIRRYPSMRVTFDDGNSSDASHALPALLERRLTASFFVIAARLDRSGSLGSTDVRELARAGMTIGSHGMHHRPWRSLGDEDLGVELNDAPRIIEAATGEAVREVACPFGDYDRRVLRAIRQRGFSRVYTVDDAAAVNGAWQQARFTVRRDHMAGDIERLARQPGRPSFSSVVRAGKLVIKRLR
jgi:hypothetical protein